MNEMFTTELMYIVIAWDSVVYLKSPSTPTTNILGFMQTKCH